MCARSTELGIIAQISSKKVNNACGEIFPQFISSLFLIFLPIREVLRSLDAKYLVQESKQDSRELFEHYQLGDATAGGAEFLQ